MGLTAASVAGCLWPQLRVAWRRLQSTMATQRKLLADTQGKCCEAPAEAGQGLKDTMTCGEPKLELKSSRRAVPQNCSNDGTKSLHWYTCRNLAHTG